MTLTEKEIFSQYSALEKTLAAVGGVGDEFRSFYINSGCKSITFIGCGSSYFLSKSAAQAARLRLDIPAYAYPAGDLLVNFDTYAPLLKNTLLVTISRSGTTSEVLMLAERAVCEPGIKCISVCAREDAGISRFADLNIEIPWAFDESVCQTRSVSNLYLAVMMFIALVSEDKKLLDSLRGVVFDGEGYMRANRPALEKVAEAGWKQAVVLADGELAGIAEEGALAFTEISLLPSRFSHALDVRHGPIVLIDSGALVVMALPGGAQTHHLKLIDDLKARGSMLAVFSDTEEEIPAADLHISVSAREIAAQGIPFIFIPQTLSLFKALARGIDPDKPKGLDAWIKL